MKFLVRLGNKIWTWHNKRMANVNGNSILSTCEYIVLFLTVILPVILHILFLREACLKDLQLWAAMDEYISRLPGITQKSHPWQHFNLCQCNFQPFLCSIYPILATAFPLHGYFVLSEVVQEDFVPYTDVIIKYYNTDVVCAPFLLALTACAGRVEPPYWGWCVQHPRFLSSWIVLL